MQYLICNDRKIAIGNQHTNLANSYVSLRYPKDIRKTIAEINPDILICEGFFKWSSYTLFQAQKMNIPAFIVYERTLHTERNCPTWRKVARSLCYPILLSNRISMARRQVLRYGRYFPHDKLSVLLRISCKSKMIWYVVAKFLIYREFHRKIKK